MPLDINKIVIKTSLTSCFGSQFKDVEGATEFIEELAREAEEVTLAPGEYVYREKDKSEYVYIPETGSIMLERCTASGSRQVFSFLFTGNLLGLSERPTYAFSAKTLTNAVVIRITKKMMKDVFEKHPAVAQRYQDVTSHILSLILDQLFVMGQKTAHQRLAHFLLDMQHRIGHGTQKFFLPMSRQDIADYLGMSLETASRGFSKLKSDGLIKIQLNYQITLLEKEKLLAYSEQ
jgi:CRP/FNR family transcriptional regulator